MIGAFPPIPWIIDIGASNHVGGDYSCLHNVHNIINCIVGLPDGQFVVATLEGSVSLFPCLTLYHVFFVPSIHCSLILVSNFN